MQHILTGRQARGQPDSNRAGVGSNPRSAAALIRSSCLRAAPACFTVTPAMTSMANTSYTLIGATFAAERVSCRPQPELAQRTDDAASGA
ncbi:MAG: hypothetical protein M3N04_07625 [Actinomycetota bacterium]|nr:hypothetical protein [Actinomycetota bacterium]